MSKISEIIRQLPPGITRGGKYPEVEKPPLDVDLKNLSDEDALDWMLHMDIYLREPLIEESRQRIIYDFTLEERGYKAARDRNVIFSRVPKVIDDGLQSIAINENKSNQLRLLARALWRNTVNEKYEDLIREENKALDGWTDIRNNLQFGAEVGGDKLEKMLLQEEDEVSRKAIYDALNSHNDELFQAMNRLREVRIKTNGRPDWHTRKFGFMGFDISGVIDIKKIGEELSQINKPVREKLYEHTDSKYPDSNWREKWNLGYYINKIYKLLSGNGEKVNFNLEMAEKLFRRMGYEELIGNKIRFARSESEMKGYPFVPGYQSIAAVSKDSKIYTDLESSLHETGHVIGFGFYDDIGDNTDLETTPFTMKIEASDINAEIQAMVMQLMRYEPEFLLDNRIKLEDKDLNKLRQMKKYMLLGMMVSSMYRVEYEDWYYKPESVVDRNSPADKHNELYGKYYGNITEKSKDGLINDFYIAQYPGYCINYVAAFMATMQIYDYAGKHFGGVYNREFGTWFKKNFYEKAPFKRWGTILEEATGEKFNPEYFFNAIQEANLPEFIESVLQE